MKLTRILFTSVVALALACRAERTFVHPGVTYTQGDLDRMRAMVEAGRDPWRKTFEALKDCGYASLDQNVPDYGTTVKQGEFNKKFGQPGRRAHDLALMWRLTDDDRYARKAVEFINAASHYTETSWKGTSPLDNGKIYLLVDAAEMMRDYTGWRPSDQERFRRMLREVVYPHIKNGDEARFGNQGLFAFRGVLAMAVYLDDEKMYDRVWRYLNAMPHRADDDPFPPGPPITDPEPIAVSASQRDYKLIGRSYDEPDYIYDEALKYYIYPNGQCQESSRDQGHSLCGLFNYVAIAEMFWNQGDDLYSKLDNRILKGLEWSFRFNLDPEWSPSGYTRNPDEVTFENEKFLQVRHRSGRWESLAPSSKERGHISGFGAPRVCARMHYGVRLGRPDSEMKWLDKAIAQNAEATGGIETWGTPPNWHYEWPGWGTLTKYRTKWMAGDPRGRLPVLPCVIKAAASDRLSQPLERAAGGKWKLFTVVSKEACEYPVTVRYSAESAGSVAVICDDGANGRRAASSLSASSGGVAEVGRISVPAGASVLRVRIENAKLVSLELGSPSPFGGNCELARGGATIPPASGK